MRVCQQHAKKLNWHAHNEGKILALFLTSHILLHRDTLRDCRGAKDYSKKTDVLKSNVPFSSSAQQRVLKRPTHELTVAGGVLVLAVRGSPEPHSPSHTSLTPGQSAGPNVDSTTLSLVSVENLQQ